MGECIKPNTCSCPKTHEGNHCEYERGCKINPITENAAPVCELEKCKVTCDTGFALSDGTTSMNLTCVQRIWSPMQSITCTRKIQFKTLPFDFFIQLFWNQFICLAFCSTPCENRGKCSEPNKCTCIGNYEGNHCEFEKGCKTKPESYNTTLNCDTEKCIIACKDGYVFPDGSMEIKMICEQRNWKLAQPQQNFTPSCKRKIN